MHIALIIVGAILGLVLGAIAGSGSTMLFPVLLGGFIGYTVAEFHSSRARGEALQRELNALKERLAIAQRRQSEAQQGEADIGSARAPVGTGAGTADGRASVAVQADAAAARAGVATEADATAARTTLATQAVSGWANAARVAPRAPADIPSESAILRAFREYFTGGNTLVRVGVLILFFGVAFLLRYIAEHSHVPIQFRLSAVACGGVALLALGWRLRPRRPGYALALEGGGVGILYLATFAALRLYSILPPAAAFAILVCLAASSAVLAVVENSQAFAFLGVTGGFLAPILASTGEGSHVVLFSYYAVLNASILAIAWYKAWQPLNLAGFAFTFVISAAWGALHYQSALFASTEPFLVLFFVFYVAIAILFSIRQPPNLRGYVDGTLVFGTPMAAFGYQSGMLYKRPLALAASAVVAGTVYFMLAWLVHRQRRSSQRLLVEVFIALGVVFLTVATPLALDGTETGVTWALEGAALVWIGARQSRVLPRAFGVLLQIFAALLQISNADGFIGAAPAIGLYLARAVTAIAAVSSAVTLQKYAHRLRSYEAAFCPVMFFLGVAEWLFCGLVEIDRYVPRGYGASVALGFVSLTALACSELARRTGSSLARLPALGLLPALVLFAAADLVPPVHHPLDQGGWLAWPLAFACFYVICRRHEGAPGGRLAIWLHVLSAWLLIGLLTWQLAWLVDRSVIGRGSWAAVGWMLLPAGALFLLPRLTQRISWPLHAHREAYVALAGGGLALYLALWSLATNLSLAGDPYPFPYVPILNALDLGQALVLMVLVRFWLHVKSVRYPSYADLNEASVVTALAALTFVWLNAALVRTLHRWAGVPLDFDAVIRSTLVQTALSIFWTVLALATMLLATRRAARLVWITGACLLAVTIVKLFAIDLSRVGTVERIVSFVGVGLLTLVIGYFSPLPPAATSHRTTVS